MSYESAVCYNVDYKPEKKRLLTHEGYTITISVA
jgi:hypothetical protein